MSVTVAPDLDAALAALALDPDAAVVAGGTDLMVGVNAGRTPLGSVVVVDRVPELRTIERDGDDLVLGSGVTFTDLLAPEVAAAVPALAMAARTVGSPQIRNAGTIGGNLGTASPAGDALPVLVALDASVVLVGPDGARVLPIAEFLVGPKRTARRPGELITAVRLRVTNGPQEFLKVGTRNAMVISVCSVAVVADVDRRTVAVGLGSVGPTVLRAPEAEAFAAVGIDWDRGTITDPELATTFGRMVSAAARPIDDHRSSADYRRHAVAVLAARALRRMFPEVA